MLQREVARLRSRLACQTKERLRLVSVKREVAEVDEKQLAAVAVLAKPAAESEEVQVEGAATEVAANSKPDEWEQGHADDGSSSSSDSDTDF